MSFSTVNEEVIKQAKKYKTKCKTFDDWVSYFCRHGASYELACGMARSQCMSLDIGVKNEVCNYR